MGKFIEVQCKSCNEKTLFREGCGREPLLYAKELVNDLIEEENDKELLYFLYSNPGSMLNPTWKVYSCKCGYWCSEQRKDVVRYVLNREDCEDGSDFFYWKFETIKRHYKKCPKCSKRMQILKKAYAMSDEKILALKCPYCRGETKIVEAGLWD